MPEEGERDVELFGAQAAETLTFGKGRALPLHEPFDDVIG
jgi:hypothetical protein